MAVSEWDLVWRLGLAFALSALIGLERQLRNKSAGLRTHTLVGVGSALFLLAGTYGFRDALGGEVVLDPSRVAAQVASGIGFIGGGLIFVRRDAVRGLTTAAGVWVTAAVGLAAGGDLPVLATATTVAYLLVAVAFPPLARRLPRSGATPTHLRVAYQDGHGVLRDALAVCTGAGFAVVDLVVRSLGDRAEDDPRVVVVALELRGAGAPEALIARLGGLDGVLGVSAGDDAEDGA
jgi:putative Mg2+ transporter-C (MgtC) family protein